MGAASESALEAGGSSNRSSRVSAESWTIEATLIRNSGLVSNAAACSAESGGVDARDAGACETVEFVLRAGSANPPALCTVSLSGALAEPGVASEAAGGEVGRAGCRCAPMRNERGKTVKLDRDEWDRDLHRKSYHVEIADKILSQLSACALRMMHHFEGSGCILTTKSKQDRRSTRMALHVTSDVIYARVQGNPQGLGGLVQGPAHISSRFYDQNELKRVIFRCKTGSDSAWDLQFRQCDDSIGRKRARARAAAKRAAVHVGLWLSNAASNRPSVLVCQCQRPVEVARGRILLLHPVGQCAIPAADAQRSPAPAARQCCF
jgi:hypothetical protein